MSALKSRDTRATTEKATAVLYTHNEHVGTEIKDTTPFTTAPKKIKFLSVRFTKRAHDLYAENGNVLISEIEEELRNEETDLVRGLETRQSDRVTSLQIYL